MSEVQHSQTVQAEEEYLLTAKSFNSWVHNMPVDKFEVLWNDEDENSFYKAYLKEHGLPLDSIIKGL